MTKITVDKLEGETYTIPDPTFTNKIIFQDASCSSYNIIMRLASAFKMRKMME